MSGNQAKPKVKVEFVPGVETFDKNEARAEEYAFLKKLKKSNFMITVNSNRARYNEAYEEKFKTFHKFLFSGERVLKYLKCKHCATGKCCDTNQDQIARCVRDVSVIVKYEISPPSAGKNANQLHSHVYVGVEHTGSVQIDITKVKQLAYRYFGYKVYISIRGSADTAFARRQYLLNKAGK
jgi:hypothetical protein